MGSRANVVDAHCHLGQSFVSGVDIAEEELLATLEEHRIDAALVMPHPYQGAEVAAMHDRVARLAERQPSVIFGMASLSPRLAEREYRAEVERCIRGHGFRAIKLDPSIHALPPNHPRCEIVFATAQEFGVPVLIHTGMGVPNALPSLAIPPALRYPDVTVVLAHAGFAVFTPEALVVAQICPNVVLEPSWCASYQVAEMVRALGADRVMYGSDHPSNVASELAKLRSIGLTADDLAFVLGGTARRVFGLDA
jgi:predicted TIM-barrel fold metal-dependent hydrolase